MFRFKRWLFCGALALGWRMEAAPPLSTIQDVLYRADGSRFNGLITISWIAFEASDSSGIAADVKLIPVSNGNFYVQLVPTTSAHTAVTYAVHYSSDSRTVFSEVWVVPPSTRPLRVRDVRLLPGVVVTSGPPPSSMVIQISDVVGLQTELNLRPTLGTAFAVSRAAIINPIGSLDGAIGSLSDCLHVDGTAGACGGGGGNAAFVDSEIPAGTLNGVNATFNLANVPNPNTSLTLFRNGLLLKQNLDYTVSGATLTFQTGATPQTGDTLLASYRLAANLPGVGFVDGETPSGAVNGVNTAFSLTQAPNPAGSLSVFRNGMRLKSGADYTVSGNSLTFAAGTVPKRVTGSNVITALHSRVDGTYGLRVFGGTVTVVSGLPVQPAWYKIDCRP